MNDNGRNITQINDNPHSEWMPRWSSNGKQIVFLRDITANDGLLDPDIYIMHADGTNDKQILDHKGTIRDIMISPNGNKLLYLTAYVGINILNIDTLNSEKILPNTHGYHCDWSPDGKQIVYVNDDHDIIEKNLWIVDADGDNHNQLTFPDPDKDLEKGVLHRLFPRWSPDGKQILYAELDFIIEKEINEGGHVGVRKRAKGTFRYIIHNIDDGITRTLKIPDTLYPSSLAWMDGQRSVLFSAYEYDRDSNRPVVTKIYRYDLTTNEVTILTEGSRPHWNSGKLPISPLGKQSMRWGELKRLYTE